MVRSDDPRDATIARLSARIEGLERILEQRSVELCRLIAELCPDDAIKASEILGGAPPGEARTAAYYALDWFRESTQTTLRDVEPVITTMWECSPRRHDEIESV